jgi:hypothetical protein
MELEKRDKETEMKTETERVGERQREEAVGNRMSLEEGAEVPRTRGRTLPEGDECGSEGADGMGISVGGY